MGSTSKRVTAVAVLAGALLLPAAAPAASSVPAAVTGTPLGIPALPGVALLPGPLAPASRPAANMSLLAAKPDVALSGATFTLSGSGLPVNKDVSIVWGTANVTWDVQALPDTVNYLGRQETPIDVVLGQTKTDSDGAFTVRLTVPKDFGGIHDIYAVIDGVQVAKTGVLIARSATISPHSGPVGTMITVTYNGLGSSLYEGGAALLYDNKYVGVMTANWTRGTAVAQIRASGPVGPHTINVADAIGFKYLNIQQSPIPWATGSTFTFIVTKDNGRPKAQVDWPATVAPTLNAKTTLQMTGLRTDSTATAHLTSSAGTVDTKVGLNASGLTPNARVQLVWSTVVGSRVNCKGTCWVFVSVPLGNATAAADGSLSSTISVPDGLGGWHVVQLLENGKVQAQVPYYVKRSVVGNGVSSLVLKEGQTFTVHLKGLGWTQLDNAIAVDYDNSYIGYGCGFNSQGNTIMTLTATGGPGTHLIDMYPLLYTQEPSFANTPYGMVPLLTYAKDEPALALGYQLPAIRLAITIVR